MLTEAKKSAFARQVGGDHYQGAEISLAEFLIRNRVPAAEGHVMKYVFRWRQKNGIEDLKKARHWIDMLQESATRWGV